MGGRGAHCTALVIKIIIIIIIIIGILVVIRILIIISHRPRIPRGPTLGVGVAASEPAILRGVVITPVVRIPRRGRPQFATRREARSAGRLDQRLDASWRLETTRWW